MSSPDDGEGKYSDTESLKTLSDSSYDTDLAASSDSECSNSDCDDFDYDLMLK